MDDEEIYRRVQAEKRRKQTGVSLDVTQTTARIQTRRREVAAIIGVISAGPERCIEVFDEDDIGFLDKMEKNLKSENWEPSQEQLFWLRDLRERFEEGPISMMEGTDDDPD